MIDDVARRQARVTAVRVAKSEKAIRLMQQEIVALRLLLRASGLE